MFKRPPAVLRQWFEIGTVFLLNNCMIGRYKKFANTLAILLLGQWLTFPVYAIILDDESPAAKPAKPKAPKKSAAELEVQRLKKELAGMKKQQLATPPEEHQEATDSFIEPGPNIEMMALPIGLLMGKYEVTQGQWRAVMGREWGTLSKFSNCGDACPVENVSSDDVQSFIEKLNIQTGKRYRLPTEAEWYAACQAGQTTEYCGSDSIETVAWYAGNARNTTHPVGQKSPNAWGLYDMSGNVWEWSSSCFEDNCSQRIIRGGSWDTEPANVHSANRPWKDMSLLNRNPNLGFRLALNR